VWLGGGAEWGWRAAWAGRLVVVRGSGRWRDGGVSVNGDFMLIVFLGPIGRWLGSVIGKCVGVRCVSGVWFSENFGFAFVVGLYALGMGEAQLCVCRRDCV